VILQKDLDDDGLLRRGPGVLPLLGRQSVPYLTGDESPALEGGLRRRLPGEGVLAIADEGEEGLMFRIVDVPPGPGSGSE